MSKVALRMWIYQIIQNTEIERLIWTSQPGPILNPSQLEYFLRSLIRKEIEL